MRFIGRKRELQSLKGLLNKQSSSLVVIRGRRRIGKSRLAKHFSSSFPTVFSLTGIPPEEGVTAEDQRKEFLRQLQTYKLPIYRCDDWGYLFHELSQQCTTGRILVILDEITWMGSEDPTFLPKLKTAWDEYFKNNPELVMIISGSNSAWITKNILNSRGFFGRISLRIRLEELSLVECNTFWDEFPGEVSAAEKFKILSVTGGVPRYLEELRSDLTAEQNLCNLCFQSEGLLFNEFQQIFHDLFRSRGPYYQSLVKTLGARHMAFSEIATTRGRAMGGDLTEDLGKLVEAGFLARDYSWSFTSGHKSQISRYRIRDNYTRFYVKYIDPIRDQIESTPLQSMPAGWSSMMGVQFENLVVNNRALLHQILQIPPHDIVNSGPYLQTQQTRRPGCQIDYLVQTRYKTLFLCEIRFQQAPIGTDITGDVQKKIDALKLTKGFSVRPVLIHVNGVRESVADSGFFARIIDFSELLEEG